MLKSLNGIFMALIYLKISNTAIAYDRNDCHYAQSYKADDLLESSQLQEEFLLRASWWQGAFARNGFGRDGVVTRQGIEFIFDSYLPKNPLFAGENADEDSHAFNEAFHLALLAAALDGDAYAMEFFRSSQHTDQKQQMTTMVTDFILSTLKKKIELYEEFNASYPGYGGYLPFFDVNRESGSLVPVEKLLSTYQFSLFTWSMIAVAQVLQDKKHTKLSNAYAKYVQLMAKNELMIFYQNIGQSKKRRILLSDVQILNETADVTQSNYQLTPNCKRNPNDCDTALYYDSELFATFLILHANWTAYGGQKAKNEIFDRIRQNKDPAHFVYGKNKTSTIIVVEKREYFLADELTKFLFLPYLDIPICEKLFLNANLVSTIYANINNYPGLFAYATHVAINAMDWSLFTVTPGIPELAYYNPTKNDVVMPYAAFPLFLHPASWRYGVVWYANMLNSTVSQTSLGAMDTIKMTGDFASLAMYWFTGPLSVLAFGGGLGAITRRYLKSTGKYDSFYRLFDQQYNTIFQHESVFNQSKNIPFALPSQFMPKVGTNRQCDPDINDFVYPKLICITIGTWKRMFVRYDLLRAILSIIALPFVILVLYISIVKHRSEKAVHKYFTLHLFVVHFATTLMWPAMLIVQIVSPSFYESYIWNIDVINYQTYIDRYYVTHFFTLIMSLTLFSLASASLLPFFYKRWLADAKKWHCYVLICHFIAFFASYPGGLVDYANYDRLLLQNGSYVLYITAFSYGFLFCIALAPTYTIIQLKKRAKAQNNGTGAQLEIKTLMSSLLYAIVPTIWCLGSQVSDFFFLMGSFDKLESVGYYFSIQEVEYYFRASYPLAHSIATLVGLGPYRRSLVKMISCLKK